MDGRQNHLGDVVGVSVNLPRPLTQVLWRDRADEGTDRVSEGIRADIEPREREKAE